jgi:hypothetical protein
MCMCGGGWVGLIDDSNVERDLCVWGGWVCVGGCRVSDLCVCMYVCICMCVCMCMCVHLPGTH